MKINDLRGVIKNKIVCLSTVDNNEPHSIAVEVNDVIDNNIIITNNQMKKTPQNIIKNPNVCLVYFDNKFGIRIEGIAKYYNSGKLLEFVKKLSENKGYKPTGVIIINIKKIIAL